MNKYLILTEYVVIILTKYEVNLRFITTSQSLYSIAKKESNISGQCNPKRSEICRNFDCLGMAKIYGSQY